MYQLWIYYQSDRDGKHGSLFAMAAKPETLRRRLKKHMTMPANYWGFTVKNSAVIKRAGFADVIERINLTDFIN